MQPRIISLLSNIAGLGILAGVVSSSYAGDAPTPAPPPPRTSATYTLSPGQTVALTPTTTLKLERVNDSRCKPGAVCVWEGYVSYSFVLICNGGSSNFVLADSMPGGSNSVTQQGLRFTLGTVEPAAPPPLNAPTATYRVSLRVDIS
jgi:hypothetical protein